jgi:outer membrane protein assembly factor BamB
MRIQARWALALLFLSPPLAAAGDWPGWRGPHGDGRSEEKNLPLRWSRTDNIHWKVAIPGRGYSSPIVWGDRVILTACLEKDRRRVLLCLDRDTGKTLWQRVVLVSALEGKHPLNSYASSTPVTDGRHIWVTFLQGDDIQVACYDFAGRRVWMRSPSKFYSKHGYCSSPVLYKDLLILNCDQDAKACIIALEKDTGRERWRTDRPNRTRSYCPPIIIHAAGKDQLVLSGSKCVASYDPATGQQYWIIDGPTEQFVASLVYLDNLLYLTGGFPEYHVLGIRPDGHGNVTHTHIAWRDTRGAAYVPSPVAWDHYFFLVSDKGIATCRDTKTGKRRWMEHLGGHHSASPLAADGYLYFPDDAGTTWVLKAGPKFEVVSKNILGEECYASPAISRGQIFLRTVDHLYCIGQNK